LITDDLLSPKAPKTANLKFEKLATPKYFKISNRTWPRTLEMMGNRNKQA